MYSVCPRTISVLSDRFDGRLGQQNGASLLQLTVYHNYSMLSINNSQIITIKFWICEPDRHDFTHIFRGTD